MRVTIQVLRDLTTRGVEMAGNRKDDSGDHANNRETNGHKEQGYDHAKTKDVSESSGGKHSKDDKNK